MRKHFLLLAAGALLCLGAGAQNTVVKKWDFTNWSAETLANCKADATNWTNIEKADKTTGDPAPGSENDDKAYWCIAPEVGVFTASGIAIKELEGLKYGASAARALAIAFNIPSTTSPVGTNAGPQFLWLGGSNKNNLIISDVEPETTITMEVESHKDGDGRGVALYANDTKIEISEGSETPDDKTKCVWVYKGDAKTDITVNNNNGCHIYYIELSKPGNGGGETPGGNEADCSGKAHIEYTCGTAGENPWDKQAIADLAIPMDSTLDTEYVVSVEILASKEESMVVSLWPIDNDNVEKNQWGGSNAVQYCEEKTVTTEWATYTWTFKAQRPHDRLQFVFGKHAGKICFANLTVKLKGSDTEMAKNGTFPNGSLDGWSNNWQGPTFEYKAGSGAGNDTPVTPPAQSDNLIPNSDCSGTDFSGYILKTNVGDKAGQVLTVTADDLTDDGNGGKCVVVKAGAKVTDPWDNQFWINIPNGYIPEGAKCKVSFRYKADKAAKVSTQLHGDAGAYIHWAAIGDVNFTTEWQTFEAEFTVPGECAGKQMHSIAFNLNELEEANTYYFDDLVWTSDKVEFTAIGQVTASGAIVIAEEVYSITGAKVGNNAKGVVIVRQRLSDGTTRSFKTIKR